MSSPPDDLWNQNLPVDPPAYYDKVAYYITQKKSMKLLAEAVKAHSSFNFSVLKHASKQTEKDQAMNIEALQIVMGMTRERLVKRVKRIKLIEEPEAMRQFSPGQQQLKHFIGYSFKAFKTLDLGQRTKLSTALGRFYEIEMVLKEWEKGNQGLEFEKPVKRLLRAMVDAFIVLDILFATVNALWKKEAEAVQKADGENGPVFFWLAGAYMTLRNMDSLDRPDYLKRRYTSLKQRIMRAGAVQANGFVPDLFAYSILFGIDGKGATVLLHQARDQTLEEFARLCEGYSSEDSQMSRVVAPPNCSPSHDAYPDPHAAPASLHMSGALQDNDDRWTGPIFPHSVDEDSSIIRTMESRRIISEDSNIQPAVRTYSSDSPMSTTDLEDLYYLELYGNIL
ncbi:hypothetical protein EJ05DRAFT_508083 [Pseudovirgaria hyperparasitica]|uniref:Uncharacterized protein n=1 Tax=Pseudovirgaria hyperparasitica TaxID=470096 RepID=A0A6A6WFZ3_9PEZI|nr:uncharacterized protein EJ05DRAFT_508083 [Pseudovirgaria hyperparasitica]KAF2760846.1 hypothetical protein EJ05DRAFT_508083 [Pseudovirgaria hyperparasitica]